MSGNPDRVLLRSNAEEVLKFTVPCRWNETINSDEQERIDMSEREDLQRENARLRRQLHRQSIDAVIEGDVRAHVVLPAAREQFRRVFKLDDDASYARVTAEDWASFRATQPRPPTMTRATRGPDHTFSGGAPDSVLLQRTREYMANNALKHLQLTGERLTFDRAVDLVKEELKRTNPDLLRAYIDQPGET